MRQRGTYCVCDRCGNKFFSPEPENPSDMVQINTMPPGWAEVSYGYKSDDKLVLCPMCSLAFRAARAKFLRGDS